VEVTVLGRLLSRIKDGLAKTRKAVVEQIAAVVPSGAQLDEDMLDEIEAILIQADVGLDTSTDLIDELRLRLQNDASLRGPDSVMEVLRESVTAAVAVDGHQLQLDAPLPAHPYVVLVVGINGVGKTTTVGKLAKRYVDGGNKVLLAACDTFRAAAIPQLAVWAERAGVEMIRPQPGADPAAVAYDGLAAARARGVDVLLVDTAGRLHNKSNLMEELRKIRRSLSAQQPDAPHEVLLVLDATSGQNTLSQAREFNQVTELTGLVLTKLDGTARGGIAIALRRELGVPVKLIGVGEGLDDLQPFDAQVYAEALFAD
jgi:fused signal recognition particle receptor